MVRLGIFASVLPLVLAGGAAPGWLQSAQPCIAAGQTTVQMARFPWQADLHIAFTATPDAATVRVQLVDSAELADFVVADDIAAADDSSCRADGDARRVAIVEQAGRGEPVVYLSTDGRADYRIFVRSGSFSARQAAALIVAARGGAMRLAEALTIR